MKLTIKPSLDKGLHFNELDPGTWFVIADNQEFLYVKIDSCHLLSVHDNFAKSVAHLMFTNDCPDLNKKEVFVVKINSVEVTKE